MAPNPAMSNEPPAECGLRTPHGPHSFNDNQLCTGLPRPDPYEPTHRSSRYRVERAWDRMLRVAGKHRAKGDPDLRGERPHPRPRPRLGWDGDGVETTEEDDHSDVD